MFRPDYVPTEDAFVTALTAFVTATENRINARYAAMGFKWTIKLMVAHGRKNIKIIRDEKGQRSVFCFVRIADGAILKAAGWNAPAKHARGSIYVNQGQDAVTEYGANYLR